MTGQIIDLTFQVNETSLKGLMTHLDTVLNPVAIAAFLGGPVDELIQTRAKARFASEGDDVTGKWKPLASATQDIRAQSGYGPSHPINKRTGQLEDYITGTPGRTFFGAGFASLVSPGTPPTGELKAKVKTAQGGKESPRTDARPVMGINEKDAAAVLVLLSGFVERGHA